MLKHLVILALLSIGMLVACGDDDDNGATPTLTDESPTATEAASSPTAEPATETTAPTETATATPPTTDCPLPAEVCETAFQLEEWLADEDLDAIVEATQTEQYTCPAEQPDGPGGPFPLCEGAPAGEERSGIQIARRYSEGAIVSAEGYRNFLQDFLDAADPEASDDYGDGALDLVAVSCSDPDEAPEECSEAVVVFSAILSGGDSPDVREVLLFWLPTEALDTDTPIQMTWTGILLEGEPEAIFEGGTLPDIGQVFPLETSEG